MNKNYLFVANWKMNFTFKEATKFAADHYTDLTNLINTNSNATLVLCPSPESLLPLQKTFESTKIKIGGQDCSPHEKGNFTGQVSAKSLQSIGCSFCIVGHSERRKHNAETNEDITEKTKNLLLNKISPLFCIGEPEEVFKAGNTLSYLEKQLEGFFNLIERNPHFLTQKIPIAIAYEPIWSIGTGNVATPEYLNKIFIWLLNFIKKLDKKGHIRLLYGGSVSSKTMNFLYNIENIDGFLIGGASLDFQELKKIIDCMPSERNV